MSEEDNETIVPEPIEEVMDPVEKLVRHWVNINVKDELDEKYEGVNLSFRDLGTLILNCFDEVQETMLESIIPEGTTIH